MVHFCYQVYTIAAASNEPYNKSPPLSPINRPPEHGSNLVVPSRVGMDAAVRQPQSGVVLVVVWCGGVVVMEAMSQKSPTQIECAEASFLSQTAKLRVGIEQTGQQ